MLELRPVVSVSISIALNNFPGARLQRAGSFLRSQKPPGLVQNLCTITAFKCSFNYVLSFSECAYMSTRTVSGILTPGLGDGFDRSVLM